MESNLNSSFILNCNGINLDLLSPKIMGIVNLTPDSFYDGGSNTQIDELLLKIGHMSKSGMDILDLGAISSRPGASVVSSETEITIMLPFLKEIRKNFPELIISLDSYNPRLIEKAMEYDLNMVNDITGGTNKELVHLISQTNLAYTIMHMQNSPINMQDNPQYENVSLDVLNFLSIQKQKLQAKGIKDVIVDPGFGFGKSQKHNYQLLKNLSVYKVLDNPILVGLSRKSMIYKLLNTDPKNALNGTTALHMLALQNGANILRVHDVKEAKECIDLYHFYNSI